MKKLLSLILCGFLMLSVAGCKSDSNGSNNDDKIDNKEQEKYISLECTQIQEVDNDTQIIEAIYNQDGSLKSVTTKTIFYEELTTSEKEMAENQAASCSGNIKCDVNFGVGKVEYISVIEDVSVLTEKEIEEYDLDDVGVGYKYDEYKEILEELNFNCKSVNEDKKQEIQDNTNEENEEAEDNTEKPEVTIVGKYVNTIDTGTYVVLNSDNTFTGRRNFCAGFHDISGTYLVDGNTLKLMFDQGTFPDEKAVDYFSIDGFLNGIISDFSPIDGSWYLIACSGGTFKLEN